MQKTAAQRLLLLSSSIRPRSVTTRVLRTASAKPATTVTTTSTSTSTVKRTMSSDADYASFLDKANQDTSGSAQQTSAGNTTDGGFASTKAVNTSVPSHLKSLDDAFYMSETDEPFEPVALEFQEEKLDQATFRSLIGHDDSVEEISLDEWNIKSQYDAVVQAVEKAGKGKNGGVKVFRVAHGETRCEYYIVALADGAVVGVKAKAVES